MTRFVIDRRTWYRGKGDKDSRMLRDDGQMCIFGQVAVQLGAERQQILNVLHPIWSPDIPWNIGGKNDNAVVVGSANAIERMLIINDDEKLTDKVRERRLKKYAARLDWELVFEH